MAGKPKTTAELNGIIAKHLDILDGADASREDIKKALAVSSLIGTQIKNENKLISYEYLLIHSGRKIKALEAGRA
jgi:hypothetical protein